MIRSATVCMYANTIRYLTTKSKKQAEFLDDLVYTVVNDKCSQPNEGNALTINR